MKKCGHAGMSRLSYRKAFVGTRRANLNTPPELGEKGKVCII